MTENQKESTKNNLEVNPEKESNNIDENFTAEDNLETDDSTSHDESLSDNVNNSISYFPVKYFCVELIF